MSKKAPVTEEVEPEAEVMSIKGNGSFIFPDGSKYTGDYVDTGGTKVREGDGLYIFGAESYKGGWANDQMSGKGKYKFASGNIYDGKFANGMFEGQGQYTFSDGATYVGSWKQNNMHGNGEYTDTNNVKWNGTFFNGMYDTGKSYISLRPIIGL